MRKKELRIRVSYETNRLAQTYLSCAYEKLIPIIKHSVKPVKKDKQDEKEKMAKQLKGNFK